MGNNQGGFHKRERTSDGTTIHRHRLQSGTGGQSSTVGSLGSSTSASQSGMQNEDEDPVSMRFTKTTDQSNAPEATDSNFYPVVFKWSVANQPPRSVYLTGSWDDWQRKVPLVKSTSDFSTIINLEPGRYEYKFLVDGKWVVNENADKAENQVGSQNNVVNIDEADFAVFDALERDLASSNAGEAMRSSNTAGYRPSHDTPNDRELEKHREFTQMLPDRREFERAANPPVLPPHLLQVILNKDTPVQCDPNVLPEPNHVMLNHLYALSIKDGVMVLSATHRHRKKYVTTLLYKPI